MFGRVGGRRAARGRGWEWEGGGARDIGVGGEGRGGGEGWRRTRGCARYNVVTRLDVFTRTSRVIYTGILSTTILKGRLRSD